ncbi:MAG TPA: endonuclease/exonuclease/phosphatase family protein [Vicinamibacterales bacterium]|nr:endonuclease/exonuclease/phosphatase family protein [Vicinamibacterales bacterium]
MTPSARRAAIVLVLFASLALAAQPAREPVSVMSFNIRYGDARDGENAWPLRRDLLFEVVRDENADVVGLQEALDTQINEIVEAVPAYAVVGVGRDNGQRAGEFSAILFKKDRFAVAEAGTFWFSDTPTVPGSKSWGNSITRICTWARFVRRDGLPVWVYNVHLDHQSQPSRERSTELLRDRIAARPFPEEPVIVTGDFNVGEQNPALHTLVGPPTGAGASGPRLFVDTFRALHPDETTVGTYNAFKFGTVSGDKIDYILVPPGTEVMRADIVRTSRGERYPSDHFPVVAQVRFSR